MYTAFYGLREKPFALSPDPRFLYLASSHREALAHLLYGIEQGEGFISITGEVGTGKTTLCRTLFERLGGDVELAFLFNPSRTALELLQSICAEFGLPAEGLNRRALMHQLNTFLVEQKRIGRRVLLIIDEAQTLSENTLEQVRLLSNLETSREKLIQILLLGQPELDRKLDERGLRQLRQRISVRWKLDPLSPQETRAYVRHRLSVAAGEPKDLFTEQALKEVHRRTGGIPRLVNQLCDRALLAGYAGREAEIKPRIVRAAAKEIPDAQLPHELPAWRRRAGLRAGGGDDTQGPPRPRFFRPWMYLGLTLALVGVSLVAGLEVGRRGFTQTMLASVFKPDAMQADGFLQVDRATDENRAGREQSVDGRVGVGVAGPGVRPMATRAERAGGTPAVSANAPRAGIELPIPPRVDAPVARELVDEIPADIRAELAIARSVDSTGMTADADGSLEPAETALAPGLLRRLLTTRRASSALASTERVLLERFGRTDRNLGAAPQNADELSAAFEDRGLMTTSFDGGSIEVLRRLDHPVALPLVPSPASRTSPSAAPVAPAGAERWVALVGIRNDRARLAGLVPDQIVTVALSELESHWLETGMILWERFESIPSLLTLEDQGPGVLWLQRALVELDLLPEQAAQPSDRFDPALAEAVRRFQVSQGLAADGVAGPLTQIAVYAQLPRYPVPRLSAPTAAPPPDRAQSQASRGGHPG